MADLPLIESYYAGQRPLSMERFDCVTPDSVTTDAMRTEERILAKLDKILKILDRLQTKPPTDMGPG